MEKIYCISGLGADERAFSKLKLPGFEIKVLPWLLPEKKESIDNYADRMLAGIQDENPILMGLSFGGMICTEIAKKIPVQKIVIISSIKTSAERPRWMRLVARLRLNRVFPLKSTPLTQPVQNLMLGASNPEEKKLLAEYRREVDLRYTEWAVNQAINWKNNWQHPHIYHIHGDSDNMFPIKYIKADYVVKNGGHFMIMNKADEVSKYIQFILH